MYKDYGGSERRKIKKLPDASYSPNSKTCSKSGCYGTIYTARIRIRSGKVEYIKTSSYSDDTFRTKKQLQYIIGTFCTRCGDFQEDSEFKALRQRQSK